LQTDFGKGTGARSLVNKGKKHIGLIRKLTTQHSGTEKKEQLRRQRSNLSSQITDPDFDGELDQLRISKAEAPKMAHTSRLFVEPFRGY